MNTYTIPLPSASRKVLDVKKNSCNCSWTIHFNQTAKTRCCHKVQKCQELCFINRDKHTLIPLFPQESLRNPQFPPDQQLFRESGQQQTRESHTGEYNLELPKDSSATAIWLLRQQESPHHLPSVKATQWEEGGSEELCPFNVVDTEAKNVENK